jgi:integrase/recombinase XerD
MQQTQPLTKFTRQLGTGSSASPIELWNEVCELRGEHNERDGDPIFVSKQEPFKRLSKTQSWTVIKKAAKRAKLSEDVTAHFLRHTHATLALKNGAPINLVQQTLGHESLATTGKYTRAFPDISSAMFLVRKDGK